MLLLNCDDDAAPKDQRKVIVEELYLIFDTGQTDKLPQIVSTDLIDYDLAAPPGTSGYKGLENLIVTLNIGFTDMRHELEQIELIDDDRIFVRWRLTGKHTGTFLDIPPSGKNVDFNGHDLFVVRDGKIVEQWHVEELLNLITQIQE